MALSPGKIVLVAKLEGGNENEDNFLQLNPNTLEISDFEKNPITCDLFFSKSLKTQESASRCPERKSPRHADNDGSLMQQIINLNKRLDDIQREIQQKRSPVHIEGNTIWITGQDGLNLNNDDIQIKQRAGVSQEKEYGIRFTHKTEESLLSGGPVYADKYDNYPKTPSAGRISVSKDILNEMQKPRSSEFIKKEILDPEPDDKSEKMSLSREILTKIKSEPIDDYYEAPTHAPLCHDGSQEDFDLRSSPSLCTN